MSLPRSRKVAMAAGVSAVIGLGLGLLTCDRRVTSPSTSRGLAGAQWIPGTEYVYSIDWNDESESNPWGNVHAAGLKSELHIAGKLVLRCFQSKAGRTLLSARLAELTRAEIGVGVGRLLGTESAGMLEEAYALLETDERGSIQRIAYANDRSGFAQYLLRGLLLHMNMSIPPSFDAPVEEWGPSGRAIVRYERSAEEPSVLRRTRLSYAALYSSSAMGASAPAPEGTLDSRTTAVLEPSQGLRSLEDQEQVAVTNEVSGALRSRSSLLIEAVERRQFEQGQSPTLDQAGELARVAPQKIPEAYLEKRIDGLTWERIEKDLVLHEAAGFIVEQKHWYWRATGLLEKQPGLAFQLVPKFLKAGGHTRGLILDLLCGSGTSQAQAAMRQILAAPEASSDLAAFSMYVQRFSFVRAPDRDSLAFVRAAYDGAAAQQSSSVRESILFTLGSMAGNARYENPSAADEIHAFLRKGLKEADRAPMRAAFLAGLGNAEYVEDADLVRPYADDPSPAVRSHALWALRTMPKEAQVQTALSLAGDSAVGVRLLAMRMLGGRTLVESDLERLEQVVAASSPMAESYASLLDMLASYRGAAALRLIQRISSAPQAEERTRARAKEILRLTPARFPHDASSAED